MGFPTVKSDPWKKGQRRKRRRFMLWSAEFWGKLVDQAFADRTAEPEDESRWVSPKCVAMISAMNELLYGDAAA